MTISARKGVLACPWPSVQKQELGFPRARSIGKFISRPNIISDGVKPVLCLIDLSCRPSQVKTF
ncbi:hypothetical protein MAR_020844 [Mya arenaria]|uniref:Uncharacterized protein n=1 Tax=Mya arenaria TaxID=6604 RepID=A0ABY7E6J1_MYAAR|nr:hypothetical protein MAR_020844 [Mya arenaria]